MLLDSLLVMICLLFFVQSLPQGIINYLLRKAFTKDYTKGSILTMQLQVVDRLWPVKLYIYEQSVGSSCVIFVGWSAFVRENTLQVGDVCVFELILRDDCVKSPHFQMPRLSGYGGCILIQLFMYQLWMCLFCNYSVQTIFSLFVGLD